MAYSRPAESSASNQVVLDYARPTSKPVSPFIKWGGMLFPSLLLQFTLLPCLCGDSIVKMEFAEALDFMFVLRATVAIYRKETGRAWLIYGMIILTSAFWIEPLLHSETIAYIYGLIGIHP